MAFPHGVVPVPLVKRQNKWSRSCLTGAFRSPWSEALVCGRPSSRFSRGEVLYEPGHNDLSLYFIRSGVVGVGTVSEDGREVIYDLRKQGDIAGELCASPLPRRDRAVALQDTLATPVAFKEILDFLQKNGAALRGFLAILSASLSSAYEQTECLFSRDVVQRVARTLQRLAARLGRECGGGVEIEIYLTQEELSRMVGASRERVSSALNVLRAAGLIDYPRRGHFVLHRRVFGLLCPGSAASENFGVAGPLSSAILAEGPQG